MERPSYVLKEGDRNRKIVIFIGKGNTQEMAYEGT